MFKKINNLNPKDKARCIAAIVLGCITLALVIAVFATGGLTNPIG